jgi:hypothetical protein
MLWCMPYSYRVDDERGVMLIEATAPNSYETSRSGIEEFARAPGLGPDFGVLLDLRENDYTPSAIEAHDLTNLYLDKFRGRPLAMVVSRLVQLGVANMISTIADLRGGSVRAFRDRKEAEAWLASEVKQRREAVS